MANLAAHINKLYTVAGLTDTNCYTHFVDTIDDAGQVALTTRFTTKAATHGVNDP